MEDAARLVELSHPAGGIVAAACRHIRERARQASDLSRLTVLLPDLHAAAAFGSELHAGCSGAVLLPRLTTLRHWAAELPLDWPVVSASAREAAIFHALAARGWFEGQEPWSLAAELALLFDELTRWHVGMPVSSEDFVRRLERAYQARAGASFDFEARLVHELWHAFAREAGDPEAAYQLRLGRLADDVSAPVYAVGLAPLAPAEAQFLQRCAERVPVFRFVEQADPEPGAFESVLHAAWPQRIERSIGERAAALREASPESPLAGRIGFCGADDAEQEAVLVAAAVRRWLRDGARSIAVVALDRMVARRARALLERSQILVRDEAGWPLSTTSAATAVGRWFDLLGNDFHHRDLLDLFKLPYAFSDQPRAQRQQAVWRFEQALRKAGIRSGLKNLLGLADSTGDAAAKRMLLRLERGADALGRQRARPLAGWLRALRRSLDAIGVRQGFEADAAGLRVLELIDSLAIELASDRTAVDFGVFRRWMAHRLEAAAFRDASIDSPVVFTALEATRLRAFDAVLVLGADAARLPGAAAAGFIFNQRVRSELGLPGAEAHVRHAEALLTGLLARSRETLVTWQRSVSGEPNLISPLFERLRTLHELAWGSRLDHPALAAGVAAAHLDPGADAAPASAPAPRIPPERLPRSISASGYNTLLGCPYRFYARYALGLREGDEVQEELGKRDYGTLVHEILARFHREHPRVLDLEPAAARRALTQVSEAVFAEELARNHAARAWLARWRALIARYLAWQAERERKGWQFHGGEIDREVTITTPGGRTLALKGRIDRVDLGPGGTVAVVDYKTRKRTALEAELQEAGEDVQLPVYALLWDAPVATALYLAMDLETVDEVALEHDPALHAEDVRERLVTLVDRMGEGAPLRAQGTEEVCRYCEMDGLCRRRHWS